MRMSNPAMQTFFMSLLVKVRIRKTPVTKEFVIGKRVQKCNNVIALIGAKRNSILQLLCKIGVVFYPGSVMLKALLQGFVTAIVHVRRGNGDVSQTRRLEAVKVLRLKR